MPSKCIVCEKTRPVFNLPGETKPTHCGGCKLENMIDIKSPKCIVCKDKQPVFNLPGKTKATHCGICKLENMVDIKNPKCIVCKKTRPVFNLPGETKATHCGGCKLENMVDIKSPKCSVCKKTRPTFNLPGQTKATHCGGCKLENMVDIKNPKCIVCKLKIPNFNLSGKTKPTHCGSCKLENMVNIKSSKCIVCKDKQSTFNLPGETKATHCGGCKLENMVDIKNPKCKSEWCNTRPTKKYKGYCLFCFMNLFPDEKVARNYKTKEVAVCDYIKTKFPDMGWICDKQINNGCSKKRPDLLLDLGYQVLIIEVDENQHNNYDCSCENKRLVELSQDLNHRPIIFIRFNPDDYLDNNNKITSCWGVDGNGICCVKKTKKNEWEQRLNILKDNVNYWINDEHKTDKTIEVVELFYDSSLYNV